MFALGGYLGELGKDGLKILSGPSDSHITVALAHTFAVTANVLECVSRYYGIERLDIFERIKNAAHDALPPSPSADPLPS